jgi:hypothetical protein
MSALSHALEEAHRATGLARKDLTVLSTSIDPYRLDTPASHAEGEWLAAELERMNLTRRIHLRGIHYALVSAGSLKPNGEPYRNVQDDWHWLGQGPAKAARWLGYIPFDRITDERNAPPVIRIAATEPLEKVIYLGAGIGISIPDAEDIRPTVGIRNLSVPQRHHLVIYGEKTSLSDVLTPIADRYGVDLYLPSGEISDSLLYQMAKTGAEDGRPMVVFVFADFDPAGNQMAVSIGRKLQAFRDLHFPDLEFDLFAVALTEEQVRELDLPSTPLKETERRADGWRAKHNGLEQTEIDALATLRPDVLRKIVVDALDPFFDRTLSSRVFEAKGEWMDRAQEELDSHIDANFLQMIRAEAEAKLATVRAEMDTLNEALRSVGDTMGVELPDPILPEPMPSGEVVGKPIISTGWSWAEQTRALIARKSYGTGVGGAP